MRTLEGIVLDHTQAIACRDAYDATLGRTHDEVLVEVWDDLFDTVAWELYHDEGGQYDEILLPSDDEIMVTYHETLIHEYRYLQEKYDA